MEERNLSININIDSPNDFHWVFTESLYYLRPYQRDQVVA
jgi:hypothetical protein